MEVSAGFGEELRQTREIKRQNVSAVYGEFLNIFFCKYDHKKNIEYKLYKIYNVSDRAL